MIIQIDTQEALNFSLSIQDCAVLDVMRKLINDPRGAVEKDGSRLYKWLSDALIMQHLQCSTFTTARQLHNIIKKLCAVGLLIKKYWYGKPYYTAITKKATAKPRPSANIRAAAPNVAAAPSIPGTSAAPTVAPRSRSAAAPNVAPSAPVVSVPSALHADPTPEPTEQEIKAAFAALDKRAAAQERRAAHRRANAPTNALIPTAQMVEDFATSCRFTDFDITGFIAFNVERNWSALRRTTWQQLAKQWYAQQIKKMDELITYTEYQKRCSAGDNNWTFHHRDTAAGVSYFIRKKAAAVQSPDNKKAAPEPPNNAIMDTNS